MGKRGPGAAKHRRPAALETVVDHPWDKAGMPPEERVLAFLRSLPIVSGIKAGANLELLEFQERFVRAVYGSVDDKGRRLVKLAALSVARGNGKSALLAGLSLAHLVGPMMEPFGECYAAALDREQAGKLYLLTVQYLSSVPWIANRVNVRDWHKEITDEQSGSIWRALTSDARKAHGLAPSFWIADEVAQWRKRDLWDNLATGMIKREQALGVTISTQAPEDHHFWSEMLDAPPRPSTYTQLHAAPEGCALDDRSAWLAANPALGVFVNAEQIAVDAERAMAMASHEPSFRLYNLNQRVDASERAIRPEDWDRNSQPFDADELVGQRCFGGLDLSSTRDLTALALWFPDAGCLLVWHWVPADTIKERSANDRVPYDLWAKEGWIEKTSGSATDRIAIVRRLESILRLYDLVTLGYDAWRFEDLEQDLKRENIELPLVKFVPGLKSYAPAMDGFERALLAGRMRHNNSPVLRWQASNLEVETNQTTGDRKPTKKDRRNRIDGLVATIIAVAMSQRTGELEQDSVYEERGIMTV